MKLLLKHNLLFLFIYVLILGIATFFLLQYDKVTIHLQLNKLVGNAPIDSFFKYLTHLGDGIFAIIIGLIILFKNIRNGFFLLASYIVSGLTTSFLKNFIYDHVNRPHFVFGYFIQNIKLKYIEGVEMVGQNSFPSGHSTTAFAVFTCLALITNNMIMKIIFLTLALLTAFSRTYLSQHWLVDITIGSLIGTLFAFIFYYIIIYQNRFNNLNKPLFNYKNN